MANFTQQQCDNLSTITREKQFDANGDFANWFYRVYDEFGNYYEFADDTSPEAQNAAAAKGIVHAHLKGNVEFKGDPGLPPDPALEDITEA